METKTQIESQINFIIWVMMVDLGSSSREGELQGGEGKREEQARCWTFTFTFFLFFQKTFTFPTRTKLTTYILTYPTRQRFHLSTVVSEDGLRAELVFDLDAREEWETSAACKQKSRKSQFGWMQRNHLLSQLFWMDYLYGINVDNTGGVIPEKNINNAPT